MLISKSVVICGYNFASSFMCVSASGCIYGYSMRQLNVCTVSGYHMLILFLVCICEYYLWVLFVGTICGYAYQMEKGRGLDIS